MAVSPVFPLFRPGAVPPVLVRIIASSCKPFQRGGFRFNAGATRPWHLSIPVHLLYENRRLNRIIHGQSAL